MQHDNSTCPGSVPIRNGIISLTGYGVSISVTRGHLTVSDGVGRMRRQSRFPKGISRIKRVIVNANTGFVTFEALRWIRDANAAIVQIDYDGSVIAQAPTRLDDARLRRAQAVAYHSPLRAQIANELLSAKIEGQIAVCQSFDLWDVSELQSAIGKMDGSLDGALLAEAKAAEGYWAAWREVAVTFARRDFVPDHWRVFASRQSPLTLRTRKAANPANAMLNYLYTLLEAEARIALTARGLDPGMGFFHADTANRSSLADDIMEPARPHVDAYVLNLLRSRTFSSKDFAEMRDGTCRLATSLIRELVETMPSWAKLVEPYAELILRRIAVFAKAGSVAIAPRATGPTESGRLKVRTKPLVPVPKPVMNKIPISRFKNACRTCGADVRTRKRVYCDACLPNELKRIQGETIPGFQAAGLAKIATMRLSGTDPTNTPTAKKRRATTASRQRRAIEAWKDDGSLHNVDFRHDILPTIQGFSVRAIAEAMSASLSHASKVRNGHLVPHKRHWKALMDLKA